MKKPDFYTREIRLIHVAKRELGLDEDTYRDILKNYGGHTSSAKMTSQQRNQVLDRFKKLGFKVKRKNTPVTRLTPQQKWKLEQLCKQRGWSDLADPALRKFIKRTTGMDDWRFLTPRDASKVITGLEKWVKS